MKYKIKIPQTQFNPRFHGLNDEIKYREIINGLQNENRE